MSKGIEILLNSARGVYLPRDAAELLSECWFKTDFARECREILAQGPDHYLYWDTWCHFVDYAESRDSHGNVWRLYQDGDLFAVCDALMTDAEYMAFYGEERE